MVGDKYSLRYFSLISRPHDVLHSYVDILPFNASHANRGAVEANIDYVVLRSEAVSVPVELDGTRVTLQTYIH